jgi:hypothetical protein
LEEPVNLDSVRLSDRLTIDLSAYGAAGDRHQLVLADRVAKTVLGELAAAPLINPPDYSNLVRRYLYVFSIPAVEASLGSIRAEGFDHCVDAQLWLTLHGRFLDDVMDDDNKSINYQNSLYLSHMSIVKTVSLLGRLGIENDFFPVSYWPTFAYDHAVTRGEDARRRSEELPHSERVSYFFHIASKRGTREALECLQAYIDYLLVSMDVPDLLCDHSSRIRTIPLLMMSRNRDGSDVRFDGASLDRLASSVRPWLEERYERARSLAAAQGLDFLGHMLEYYRRRFEDELPWS